MKLYPVLILFLLHFTAGIAVPARAQNISGIVNSYHHVTGINTTTNTLTLDTAAGLTSGVKVLVIQMKGAAIDNTNTATFGNVSSIGNAGNYEFNYVCGVNGKEVMLVYALQRTYDVPGMVQLVTVPQYTAAVVTDTLKAAQWDPATGTGGIIALEARSLTLTRPIDASSKGFAGGAYVDHPIPPFDCNFSSNITSFAFANPASGFQTGGTKGEGITAWTAALGYGKGKLANGGGGANNHNSGGAGGSNYGTGGGGGQRSNEGGFNCHGANPGIGGLSLSAYGYTPANNRVFMGGGGGAGQGNNNVGMPGGNGGGIIFIKADTVQGNNEFILSNGGRPYRADLADPYAAGGDGGGGGGGGGVIVADVTIWDYSGGNAMLQANGAAGSYSSYTPSSGCFGPGGGGGGGVIWVKTAALIPQVQTNFTGGINGLISVTTSVVACRGLANGATAGSAGDLKFNYVPPVITGLVCAPLAVSDLLSFKGREVSEGVELTWKMSRIANIKNYIIERSVNQVNYSSIASVQNNNQYNFLLIDKSAPEEFVYYRLKIIYADGTVLYSAVIAMQVQHRGFKLVRLSPNPASKFLSLQILSEKSSSCEVKICSRIGEQLLSRNYFVRKGINNLNVELMQLSAGTYFVAILQDGRRAIKSFIKN
jgi:hypothetical protein